jgi:GTPase-activator protein for Ras-like GTPase
MKRDAVMALSHLIFSNVKIGFQHALSRAYENDSTTKTTYLVLLTQILQLGSVQRFLQLPAPTDEISKYGAFTDLITEEPLSLLTSLCQHCSIQNMTDVAQSLFQVFGQYGKRHILILEMSQAEVAQTDVAPNLFRRNSIASHLLTLYAHEEILSFLEFSLGSILSKLSEMQDTVISYEIDPGRVEASQISTNLKNLEELTQSFLNSVIDNMDMFPASLRWICSNLFAMVNNKFPGAGRTAVGGFVFLRIICPAIASPDHQFLNVPIKSSSIRRGLILVTKIIQTISNFVVFGGKEFFMEPLNPFVLRNQPILAAFIHDICVTYMLILRLIRKIFTKKPCLSLMII